MQEQRMNFDRHFEETFKRKPTEEDWKRINAEIHRRDPAPSDWSSGLSLTDAIYASLDLAEGATEADVNAILQKMSAEEAHEKLQAHERKRTITGFVRKTLNSIVVAAAIGVMAGTAATSYRAFQDDATQAIMAQYDARKTTLEREYAQREAALNQRFFGPLPTLAAPGTSTFTPLEQKLILNTAGVDINSGDELLSRTYGPVQVVVKSVMNPGNDKGNELKVIRMSNGQILSVNTYSVDCPGTCNGVGEMMSKRTEITPRTAVLFGNDVKTISYSDNTVTVRDKMGSVTYRGEEGMPLYTQNAQRMMAEVKTALARGPNP